MTQATSSPSPTPIEDGGPALTAEQKVKYLIINSVSQMECDEDIDFTKITADEIEAAYDDLRSRDEHWDAENEVREGEVETGLPCPFSRHYEAKAVAARLPDGSWVGWTYWFGGGKHGEPESIDWIDEAYDLVCTEQEKLVVVRTFSLLFGRKGGAA